jgi:hypothetical protein
VAELAIHGGDLVVRLGPLEKIGALRGDIRVALAHVREIRAVGDASATRRGLRAAGTGLPGVVALGTYRGSFGKDFVAIYGHDPGVVVELQDAGFARVVISDRDPNRLVTLVRAAMR